MRTWQQVRNKTPFPKTGRTSRRHPRPGPRARHFRYHPCLEFLEDRTLFSVQFTPAAYATPAHQIEAKLGTMGGATPIEPAIAVNPANPDEVAVSSQNGIEVSTNAGGSFTAFTAFPGSTGGDTSMAYDGAGRLFWVNLTGAGVGITQIGPVTGTVLPNTTFTVDSAPAGTADDKEVIGVDTGTNNLYVVWSQKNTTSNAWSVLLRRSTDRGATWSSAVTVSGSGEGFVWPSTVSVKPGGDVYVAYHSQTGFSGGNPDGTSGKVYVARYNNDLSSLLSKTLAFTAGQADVTFNAQAQNNPLPPPATIPASRTIPGAVFWTQGSAQPYVLADPTRPNDVYVVAVNGSYNVQIARSTDNGATWTIGTVDTPSGSSFDLFPTAAIDQDGNIAVAWYSNSRGLTNSAGHYKLDVFARYSTDGGATFSAAFMVNSGNNPFDPDPGAAVLNNGTPQPPATYRIGEYFGLALSGGTAYLAWNGNTYSSGTPVGQQVWFDTFALRGGLSVTGTAGGAVYVRNVSGNPAFVEVDVNGQPQYTGLWAGLTNIDIHGGGGDDTVAIQDVGPGVSVLVIPSQVNTETVNLGNPAVGTQDIQGTVTVRNARGYTALNIDDRADGGNRTVTMDWAVIGLAVIRGLTPNALIEYYPLDVGSVSVLGGGGSNVFTVNNTALTGAPAGTLTTVSTGDGNDTVQVNGTTGPLSVVTGTGQNQVTVGSAAAGLDNTNGSVSLSGSIGQLLLDDSHSAVVLFSRFNYVFDRGFFQRADKAAITYSGVQNLTFTENTSNVADFAVVNTNPGGSLSLNNVGGADRVFVQNTTAGPLSITNDPSSRFNEPTFRVGPNLSNIQNTVAIHNPGGYASGLILDDTAAPTSRQLDIVASAAAATFQASGAAAISVDSGQFYAFSWYGGNHGNVVHVHGNPAGAGAGNYNFGAGTDSLSLSSATAGNRISNLQSVDVTPGAGSGTVFLDDSDETNPQTYQLVVGTSLGQPYCNFATQGTTLGLGLRPNGSIPAIVLTGSSSGNNTLIAPNASTTFRVSGSNAGSLTFFRGTTTFASVQNLTGSSGLDTFSFADGASVDGNLSDSGGSANTLDYSAYSTPVTVDLSQGSATGVGGTVSNIGTLVGGQSDDSLTGNAAGNTTFLASPGNDTVTGLGSGNILSGTNAASTWNITAQDSGTLSFGAGTTTFSGVQELDGGSGADDFIFADGAGVDGNLHGGGGGDTLDESAYSTPVTVNLAAGTATGVGGFVDLLNGWNFVGSAGGGSTLIGPIFATTWNLSGTDAGTVDGVSFANFSNLTGGRGANTFVLADGAGVDGTLDGGDGGTLNESAYSTPVTVDLTADAATGVAGFVNIQSFVGSAAGGNTLNGPAADTTWGLIGHNAGTLNGGFSFTGFQDLTGGAGNNTFLFFFGGSVDGTLTGGGGTNRLSYVFYVGNVLVDLQSGIATGVGGGVANFQSVTGTSSGGRNLLIAGSSAANLVGGGDNDILIAGTTDYDNNLAALLDIMSVWDSADSYANRVARLVDDPTYAFSLNASTVHSNGGGNTLTGKPGGATPLDLYFANLGAGDVTDAGPGDRLVGIV